MNDKQVNTEIKPSTYKPEDFAKSYQELCERMGYRIVVSPAWISRDDGTFSLVLQSSVGELPKKA